MSASFIRAFFAINFAEEDKAYLASAMDALKVHLRQETKRKLLRWVRPHNLHLTLQFFAQINEAEIEELLKRAQAEIKGLPSFNLSLGPLEWFPSSYRPSVLSLKAEPQEALTTLSAAIGEAALALGYAVDQRPFRGHLTLARVDRLHKVDPESLNTFNWPLLPEITVSEVVFFKSEPQEGGSLYTQLRSLKLKNK